MPYYASRDEKLEVVDLDSRPATSGVPGLQPGLVRVALGTTLLPNETDVR